MAAAKAMTSKQPKALNSQSKSAKKPLKGKNQKPKTKSANVREKNTPKAAQEPRNQTSVVTTAVTRMQESGTPWYQMLPPLKAVDQLQHQNSQSKKSKKNKGKSNEPEPVSVVSESLIQERLQRAKELLDQQVEQFESKKSSRLSSDDKYLSTMIKSGTLADRVAALTLTIQSSPFHNLNKLNQLIAMASKKARRESLLAINSLRDLFINNLLPDDRKLTVFAQQPLLHPSVTDKHLVFWYFEHALKLQYGQLVAVLANGMNDAVDNHKRGCIRAAYALLAAKPEQEATLLSLICNKLGDPDRKIAAFVHKMLQELLQEHPVMKQIVAEEVERLLLRPQVNERTRYNSVLFLNQMYLDKSEEDTKLANHLIKVYFGIFSKEIHGAQAINEKKAAKAKSKQKDKKSSSTNAAMDRKLLSSLLIGVNRAFPFADCTSADFQQEIDSLFQVVHQAHFATSVQALMLLFQVMNSTNSVSDRFYSALYAKLFDPKVRETSKHTLFLNVLFRAMKADVSPTRTCAFIKRLLQLSTMMPASFMCAALFLVSELCQAKPQLRSLFNQPEDKHASDARADQQPRKDSYASSDDEEDESPKDVQEANENTEEEEDEDVAADHERTARVLGAMFDDKPDDDAEQEVPAQTVQRTSKSDECIPYDPMKRNPLFAHAEQSCAWEIAFFLDHHHPSVRQFAKQVVHSSRIEYASDPLVDFTLSAFLEKFITKKPRAQQIASSSAAASSFVDENQLLSQVDASDEFFYQYFQERSKRMGDSKKKGKKSSDDVEGDALSGDEEDEEEMDAFADQLAEDLMEDGNLDDEDPDMDDWSGPEDGSDDDIGEDDDDDDDGAILEGEDDDGTEALVFGDGDDDDGQDDEDDAIVFGGGEDSDGEEEHPTNTKQSNAKNNKANKKSALGKRSSAFMDADEFFKQHKDAASALSNKAAKKKQKRSSK